MNARVFRRIAAALLWLAVAASVHAQSTTTSFSASPNPATANQSITFTAVVTAAGSQVSEGTVTFYADGNTFSGSTFVAVSGGVARCTTQLAAGQHTLRAQYGGSSHYASSVSPNYNETVNLATTATTAANATAAYSSAAQDVPLSASVTSGGSAVNGGSVLFAVTSGGAPIGPQNVGALNSGTASGTFHMSAGTAPGVYPIQASYSGSSVYAGSIDQTHTLTVTAPLPTAASAQGAQIIGCSYTVFTGTGFSGSAISGAFTDVGGNPWPGAGANQLTFSTTCQNSAWSATVTIPAGANGSGLTLTISQVVNGQTATQTAAYTGIVIQTAQAMGVPGLDIVSGHPTVTMNGCPGRNYILQRTDSLTAPTWNTVAVAMPSDCGPLHLVDPAGAANAGAFYRVLVQ